MDEVGGGKFMVEESKALGVSWGCAISFKSKGLFLA